jgi:hypothetical protein
MRITKRLFSAPELGDNFAIFSPRIYGIMGFLYCQHFFLPCKTENSARKQGKSRAQRKLPVREALDGFGRKPGDFLDNFHRNAFSQGISGNILTASF